MRQKKPIPAASAEPWNVEPDAPPAPVSSPYDDTTVMDAVRPDAPPPSAVNGPLSAVAADAPPPPAGQPPAPPTHFPLDPPNDTPPPAPRHRPDRRGVIIAAALLLGVIAIAAVGYNLLTTSSSTTAEPAPPQTHTATATAAPDTVTPADTGCPTTVDGSVTTGRDRGDTSSGPAVIKAFEYAYYVERDGRKARSFGTELARVPTAEQIQDGINQQIEIGTTHCLAITDRGNGLFGVELTVVAPGGVEPQVLRQLIQTAQVDGRTLITAITKDTSQ